MRYRLYSIAVGALLFADCTQVAPPPATAPDQTLLRLREFKSFADSLAADDEKLKHLEALNGVLTQADLPTVEAFALTPEGKPFAFAFARLLIERGRYDSAANLIVTFMLDIPQERDYRMWKWWEFSFGSRPDYSDMSIQMADSLVSQFNAGPLERRIVVAEIFSKGADAAALSPPDFRKLIFSSSPAKSP